MHTQPAEMNIEIGLNKEHDDNVKVQWNTHTENSNFKLKEHELKSV